MEVSPKRLIATGRKDYHILLAHQNQLNHTIMNTFRSLFTVAVATVLCLPCSLLLSGSVAFVLCGVAYTFALSCVLLGSRLGRSFLRAWWRATLRLENLLMPRL